MLSSLRQDSSLHKSAPMLRREIADETRLQGVFPGVLALQWWQLRWFERRLPANTQFIFLEAGFWERYKWRVAVVAALLLLQTALIAALLSQRSKSWRATRSLADSEARNRDILMAIPDLMFLQSADGVYLDYHVRDPKTLLLTPAEFLGRNMSDVLPPDLASALRARFNRALETSETQLHEYELSLNGKSHWFEARIAPCNGSKILSVVRDITERKNAVEALVNSEEFNRRIVESSSDCVKILDVDGNLVYMGERGQKLLEIPDADKVIGTSWIDLWSGEDRINARKALEKASRTGNGSFQGLAKTMKGTPRWWDTVITPIGGTNGNVERLLAVSRDITEQKRAIDTIRESEERFAKAFQANPQPMSLTHVTNGEYLDVNESFLAMSGYTREEVIGHTSVELSIFETQRQRESLLVRPLLEKGALRNFEMNFRTKSGAFRVLLSSAELLDLGGQQCILVASSDISERKALEEELRLSEREFSTIVQNSPDIIFRLDRDLRYIYISPAFERVSGLSRERFIGKTSSEMMLPDNDWQSFEDCCRRAIVTRKRAQRDSEYNGRYYRTRIIPEFAPDGLVESVMTISEDVTDRIHSEQELTQLTVRLFNLQDEERRRIARELHDGTAQNLFAISVNLAKLNQLTSGDADETRELIAECQSLGDQALQEIRTLSYVLHPPLLDQVGLVSALQWYVEGFSKRSGVYVDIFAQPIGRLPREVEMALFRVVQEALTNVRRHSGSETATIRLEKRAGEIVLEIRDRGQGLASNKQPDDQNGFFSVGVGIPGMRQRLRQLGGRLDIVSHHHGMTISAVVPHTNGVNHVTHSSRGRS